MTKNLQRDVVVRAVAGVFLLIAGRGRIAPVYYPGASPFMREKPLAETGEQLTGKGRPGGGCCLGANRGCSTLSLSSCHCRTARIPTKEARQVMAAR